MDGKRRIGVHTSIAGGIFRSLERARDLRCTTLQIFSHNPRGWGIQQRDREDIRRFRDLKKSFDLHPVFIHTSYLINLASGNPALIRKSIDMVATELRIADELDVEYVVLHTGSASGDDPMVARKRAIESLTRVSEQGTWNAGLLLENTAGERGDITSRIADIAEIADSVPRGLIAGICFDTCHGFAAGYGVGSKKGMEALAREIDTHLGRDRVRLVHLNDTKGGPGSGIDRHEHIGKGKIGLKGIRNFLGHTYFLDIPLILETPKKSEDDDRRNLDIVKKLL